MIRWKFRVYESPHGKPEVQQEINRYGDAARESFSAAIRHLSVTPRAQWQPDGKKLKNEDPLYEIRYTANRCATRALGYFADNGETFVITNICTHKQKIYKPPDAFEIAHRRVNRIRSGTATTVPLQVDGEDFPPNEG